MLYLTSELNGKTTVGGQIMRATKSDITFYRVKEAGRGPPETQERIDYSNRFCPVSLWNNPMKSTPKHHPKQAFVQKQTPPLGLTLMRGPPAEEPILQPYPPAAVRGSNVPSLYERRNISGVSRLSRAMGSFLSLFGFSALINKGRRQIFPDHRRQLYITKHLLQGVSKSFGLGQKACVEVGKGHKRTAGTQSLSNRVQDAILQCRLKRREGQP